MAQNLVDVCGRLSKYVHLPKFVFELTGREQNILLTALLQGDGTKKPDGSYTYYTTSPQLADDVQRLCVCAGHSSHITGPYHYGNPLHEPVYHVHLWKHPEKTKRVEKFYQQNPNIKKFCFEFDNHVGIAIRKRLESISESVFPVISNWSDLETEEFALDILGPIDFEKEELEKLKAYIKSLPK